MTRGHARTSPRWPRRWASSLLGPHGARAPRELAQRRPRGAVAAAARQRVGGAGRGGGAARRRGAPVRRCCVACFLAARRGGGRAAHAAHGLRRGATPGAARGAGRCARRPPGAWSCTWASWCWRWAIVRLDLVRDAHRGHPRDGARARWSTGSTSRSTASRTVKDSLETATQLLRDGRRATRCAPAITTFNGRAARAWARRPSTRTWRATST